MPIFDEVDLHVVVKAGHGDKGVVHMEDDNMWGTAEIKGPYRSAKDAEDQPKQPMLVEGLDPLQRDHGPLPSFLIPPLDQ